MKKRCSSTESQMYNPNKNIKRLLSGSNFGRSNLVDNRDNLLQIVASTWRHKQKTIKGTKRMKGIHKILVKSMKIIKNRQKKRNNQTVFISTAIATVMSPPSKMLMMNLGNNRRWHQPLKKSKILKSLNDLFFSYFLIHQSKRTVILFLL